MKDSNGGELLGMLILKEINHQMSDFCKVFHSLLTEKKKPISPGVENLQGGQDVAQGLLFADVRVLGQDDLCQ